MHGYLQFVLFLPRFAFNFGPCDAKWLFTTYWTVCIRTRSHIRTPRMYVRTMHDWGSICDWSFRADLFFFERMIVFNERKIDYCCTLRLWQRTPVCKIELLCLLYLLSYERNYMNTLRTRTSTHPYTLHVRDRIVKFYILYYMLIPSLKITSKTQNWNSGRLKGLSRTHGANI